MPSSELSQDQHRRGPRPQSVLYRAMHRATVLPLLLLLLLSAPFTALGLTTPDTSGVATPGILSSASVSPGSPRKVLQSSEDPPSGQMTDPESLLVSSGASALVRGGPGKRTGGGGGRRRAFKVGNLNLRPMVGVLTHPFRRPGSRFHDLIEKNGSFIAASYVKMLQAGGLMVAPVFFDATRRELEKVFKKINMLVIPGGWASLEPGSPWHRASRILLDLALEENDRGEYFAIHGTCRGFEMLSVLVAGGHHVLETCESEAYPTTTRFMSQSAKKAAMFAWMEDDVIEAMETKNIAMHNHKKGIRAYRFDDNEDLSNFFEVLTTSYDRDGKEFVSTMSAYQYPITGTSWHGEKPGLEWFSTRNVPRAATALQVMQATGNFLASEARKSSHMRDSDEEETNMVIANFPILFDAEKRHRTYDEVYRLPPFEDWEREQVSRQARV